VGIGASAGGLEALEEFFRNLPPSPALSYVVVQHLSPDYKSLMVELLSKYTDMEVVRAEDGMPVEPRRVYLITPRKNLNIFHGRLYLSEQEPQHGIHLPIDIFLRSLAEDAGDRAIAVILSGTGSDGTLGIRAVKGAGGLVFAQDNLSAKFDGMPRSASATGLVDYILPPKKIAEELEQVINHPLIQSRDTGQSPLAEDASGISQILSIMRDRVGVDFSGYKESTILRRIERRISINRLDTLEDYVDYVRRSSKEIYILHKDLLIGVTKFFRDPEAFEAVADEVLPALLEEKRTRQEQHIRIWCPGCSTGEEPYSLAIVVKEKMEELNCNAEVKIFATDIDRDSIEYASVGVYPESIVTDIDQKRLHRNFTKKENTFQVNGDIRQMVIFAHHNVMKDPPFSSIDFVSCRNMLIYLKPEVQQTVLQALHYSLRQGGFLFLGPSETVGDLSYAFTLLQNRWKVYRCTQQSRNGKITDSFVPPSQPASQKSRRVPLRENRAGRGTDEMLESAYEYLIGEYVPPAIMIDSKLELIHVCRDAHRFLKVPKGYASLNLMELVPGGLKAAVSTAVHKAVKESGPVTYRDLPYKGERGTEHVALSVRPVLDEDQNPTGYYLVIFDGGNGRMEEPRSDSTEPEISAEREKMVSDLEQELQYTKENLQATIEELETSNEELQATNEELIASNEELQSTNEELQSVNEELYTVNSEYQNKIEELSQLNNDMKNFLDNTDIGMIFLDTSLRIRKYTPAVTRAINVMEMDIGRPIGHLSRNIEDPDFESGLKGVLESLEPMEKELQNKEGTWILMKILPYRTMNNVVEGIVLTFVDIDAHKRAEEQLVRERDLLMRVLEHSPVGKTMVNAEGKLVFVNQRAAEIFGLEREEVLQRSFDDRGWKITDREGKELPVEQLPFGQIKENGQAVYNFVHAVEKPDGSRILLRINGSPSYDQEGALSGAVFSLEELPTEAEAGEEEESE
jgi:two-component system CheB/CheR fusion protein